MSSQVFAYIIHKNGKADDTALELPVAAKKIFSDASPIAIVMGSGTGLDGVCAEISSIYSEVWKFEDQVFGYPNAEVIRKVLVKNLPEGAIIILPHDTFGMDLAPGLSIKLDSIFVSDVVDFERLEGNSLKMVRQEFNGQVSTHLASDISGGAVISIRPGVFQPGASSPVSGKVIDKSSEAGDLASRRRFIEVVEAEAGDVDITKEDILVSVGRGVESPG
jgi:electron transfer flavoprotein alpha subunit